MASFRVLEVFEYLPLADEPEIQFVTGWIAVAFTGVIGRDPNLIGQEIRIDLAPRSGFFVGFVMVPVMHGDQAGVAAAAGL